MGNEPGTEGHQMPNTTQHQHQHQQTQHRSSQPTKVPQAQPSPTKIKEQQKKPAPSASTYTQPHPHQQYKPPKLTNNGHGHGHGHGHTHAQPHVHSHTHNHTHNLAFSNGYKHNNGYINKHMSPSMHKNIINTTHQVPKKEVLKVSKTEHFRLNTKMSIKDFEILKLVGKGSFGEVWQVQLKQSKTIYALKILKKKDLVARKQVIHTNTERRILANIDHPFLVSLRFAFQTKSKLFMVMDFFNGGELFFHLQNEGKFPEERARFYSAEICLAIECLHVHNITYRDLKPENILLDMEGHIKLTDFGLSKECISSDPSCVTRTFCGSPEYLAPEMLQQCGYNQMVDWWSFGTILYEMICGLPPFYDQNIQKMYQNILYKPIPFYHFMSRGVIELISKLLIKNPVKRIKCEKIKASQFFVCIDWDRLYNKELKPPFKPKVMSKGDVSNFQQFTNSQSNKVYLNATPSLKTRSLMAAEGKFPGFSYDETSENNQIFYVD